MSSEDVPHAADIEVRPIRGSVLRNQSMRGAKGKRRVRPQSIMSSAGIKRSISRSALSTQSLFDQNVEYFGQPGTWIFYILAVVLFRFLLYAFVPE